MSIPSTFFYDNIIIGNTILNSNSQANFDTNINITSNSYISFGSNYGFNSYGLRDNNGILEFKNINGNWNNFDLSGSSIPNDSLDGNKIINKENL